MFSFMRCDGVTFSVVLCVYQFFKAGNTNITTEMVGEVVGLVESEMGSLEVGLSSSRRKFVNG